MNKGTEGKVESVKWKKKLSKNVGKRGKPKEGRSIRIEIGGNEVRSKRKKKE